MSVTPQRTRDDSTTKNHGCSKNKEGRDVSFARGDPKSKTVVPQYRALILRENESIFPLFSQKNKYIAMIMLMLCLNLSDPFSALSVLESIWIHYGTSTVMPQLI